MVGAGELPQFCRVNTGNGRSINPQMAPLFQFRREIREVNHGTLISWIIKVTLVCALIKDFQSEKKLQI